MYDTYSGGGGVNPARYLYAYAGQEYLKTAQILKLI